MISFWWDNEKDHLKIPWVSWEKMCRRKEIGGLGFRDIGRFNQALLGKQAWRIWEKPSSLLAQILKHKYFKRKTFLEAGKGTRPSFAWRSILFDRELLSKGLFKTIGNGQNTKVWEDKWLPDKFPRPPVKPSVPYDGSL
ncbi:putative mitochondrial protein [Cardamine amara subsp. amara]|uniref:Mitochondrial protein n=1 Tax=Cardamine amara subsp. amara TaxID=228776 RepID=A0ABD0ZYF2_CARAN